MDGIKSELATKLLNSPDAKVAAAAKRIFFEAEPIDEQRCQHDTVTPTKTTTNTNNTTSSSLLIHKFGTTVPADIKEAAKTVVMMAPKHKHVDTPVETPSLALPIEEKQTSPQAESVVSLTSHTSLKTPKPLSPTIPSTILPPIPAGKKLASSDERLQRSRERNKMHARKTRQRKKEHMNQLESKVQVLKQRQISVKLLIKEKNTASILLGMISNFSDMQSASSSSIDPKVDELMKRSTDDIPDSTKIPDLPALILPGHHNKRRRLESGSVGSSNVQQEYPNDGIDYELLGKDRTSCTPEELDKIRKERNRMHAKRTRDRKRIFMEEMEKIIKQLEDENDLLEQHLAAITTDSVVSAPSSGRVTPSLNSPAPRSAYPTVKPPTVSLDSGGQCSSENLIDMKGGTPQNAAVIQEASTSLTPITAVASDASKPQHESLKAGKGSSLPLTVLASSEVSTVSMSPTPHHNHVSPDSSTAGGSTNEMSRNLSSDPLKLPASITTTSETPIQC